MRRTTLLALATALLSTVAPGPSQAGPGDPLDPGRTLPNLVPDIRAVFIDREGTFDPSTGTTVLGPPKLYFDTWVINRGDVALQLTLAGAPDDMATPVSQCVSWTDRLCRAEEPVGGFAWHDEHQHWHFEDFASYELRRVRPNGRLDTSRRGALQTSDKVSFCMMDTSADRPTAFPVGYYQTCTPTLQGISPGWSDTYGPGFPGQQLSLEGLGDGRYAVIVHLNYANRLLESDTADNVVVAIVEVSGNVTQANIVGTRQP